MAGKRRDDLVGDGFDIECVGQCSHTRTLSEVMEGTSKGDITITSECPGHKADITTVLIDVRFRGQNGHQWHLPTVCF